MTNDWWATARQWAPTPESDAEEINDIKCFEISRLKLCFWRQQRQSKKVLWQRESWKIFLHKAAEPTETNPLTWQNVLGLFVLSLQPINLQHCMPDGVTLAESHPGLVFLDRRWAQRSPWAPWQSGKIRYLFVPPAGMSRVARAQTACWGRAEEEVKLLEKKGMVEFFMCNIDDTQENRLRAHTDKMQLPNAAFFFCPISNW